MNGVGFMELMDQGGPVMWVIFVVAWVAFILLCERTLRVIAWRKSAAQAQRELQGTKDDTLPKGHSPIAQIVAALDWSQIKKRQDLAEHMSIQLSELMPRMEGSLPTIAVLGSLLPMLGLLGTVMGMIEVFHVIALHGTGDPQQMADGISQALLTTASGLIIAIPVIFFHHLLVRELRSIISVTEQSMHAVYIRYESRLD
ncbi:MAG: MotA/TolQ/ExbB proton channel family protein [Gammaproteobacteria bacterium]|nr:MotA/TolQ/ExbB proton channel family protein [Gammaproteobacteria bacterium]